MEVIKCWSVLFNLEMGLEVWEVTLFCTLAFSASTAYPIVIGTAGVSLGPSPSPSTTCSAPGAVGGGGVGCRFAPAVFVGSGGGRTQVSSPSGVIAIAGGCAFINFFVFLIHFIKCIKKII